MAVPIYIVSGPRAGAVPVTVSGRGGGLECVIVGSPRGGALPVYIVANNRSGSALGIRVVGGTRQMTPMVYAGGVLGVASANLLAYWPLNETSGDIAFDYSGANRHGRYRSGFTLGQTGIGDGGVAPTFNGTTGYVDIWTQSLADAFNGSEGTMAIWGRVSNTSTWTDGVNRRLYELGIVAATDKADFQKSGSNNTLVTAHVGSSVSKTQTISTSTAGWFHMAMTWSKSFDRVRTFFNGAQVGPTQAGLGLMVGSLSSATTVLAATDKVGGAAWPGQLAHAALWNAELSASQIASLATVVS